MKKFFIILSYGVLIAIIIFLFEAIMSGTYCHCGKVYCPSTKEQQLLPNIT